MKYHNIMKYNWEEIAEYCKNNDKYIDEVTERFECSYRTLNRILNHYGIKIVKRNNSRSKHDWDLIQQDINNGLNWREIELKHGCKSGSILHAKKKGKIKTKSRSDAMKWSHIKYPEKYNHTKKTKNKISKARKKFLEENPDKAPYLLNHYSKGPSYPEKYFAELFKKEKIDLDRYHQIGLYQLDFADLKNKIDIEIDGSQHRHDSRVVASDINRTNWLTARGWKVYRVYWPDWKRMSMDEKKEIVEEIRNLTKETI